MTDFFAMGGYAFFVWASFGVSCLGLLYIYFSAKHSFKQKEREIILWLNRSKEHKNVRFQQSNYNPMAYFFSSKAFKWLLVVSIPLFYLIRFIEVSGR